MKNTLESGCKRILAMLLVTVSVLTSVWATPASAEDNGVEKVKLGVVTANGLNVREAPDPNSQILTVIPEETKVAFSSKSEGGWVKIMIGGYVGYVTLRYIQELPDGDANLSYGKAIGEVVYVREGPGTSYPIVARVVEDGYVKIVGIQDGWFKVTLTCKGTTYEGFMSPNYVLPVKKSEVEKLQKKASSGSGSSKSSGSSGSSGETSIAYQLIEICKSYIGVPYVWGGSTPSGFDCGGFTKYCYAKLGYSLPHTRQIDCGSTVSYDNLSKGDLVFFSSGSQKYGHVGIYISGGRFIHAPAPGKSVTIDTLASGYYYTHYTGARRIL